MHVDGDKQDGEPPFEEAAAHEHAGESQAGNSEGVSDLTGSLQERLAAHGRRLADSAGELQEEGGDRLGGLVESAEHFSFGSSADEAAPVAAGDRLAFDEPAHLPWLESADEDDDDGAIDTRRVALFVASGIALLAAIVGGIWWSTHRGAENARVADGSVIPAPAGPYKAAPGQPGGKTYDGTGASSFEVSQGHVPSPRLAGSEAAASPAATASALASRTVHTAAEAGAVAVAAARAAGQPAAAATTPAAASAGGIGVQVGAYTSQASAEAGWSKLVRQYAPLGEVHHRIVQGQADIGTVYRLQAVPGSESAANALCTALKAQSLACQVKH